MHTDEDIEDRMYQDGEHRMHIDGYELEPDSMATAHSILNLESNEYGHCKTKNHVNNTRERDADRFLFECSKHSGIGNGMLKYPFVKTEYNSLAINTSSWIVLITRYMHTTTLHRLEGNEHRIVCNRLDGRGVTNVEHLGNIYRYASNLSGLKRYL